ncbi:unnamed protein product [Rotaria sp. Silwood2]|nr:unnamed protein product [Rotaria sp. Silwood2]
MLDTETDAKLCSHVHDRLVYMLQALGANNLTHWLQLCKDILAAIAASSETDQQQTSTTATTTILSSSSYSKHSSRPTGDDDEDSFGLHDDDADYADTAGNEQLQTSTNQNSIRRATSSAK